MELPHLGKHCSVSLCNRLDFLPVSCDACKRTFCTEHYKYEAHGCTSAEKKNVQVPVCPLCNSPVSGRRGEAPDVAVSEHIDRDCKSDPAQAKRKVFNQRCSFKKCKQKELVPITCDQCKMNYCLKHRHAADHECLGKQAVMREAALRRENAPASRSSVTSTSGTTSKVDSKALQGHMSEKEALQRALQISRSSGSLPRQAPAAEQLTQEEEDEMLARAIAESERDAAENRPVEGSRGCSIA